jgi:hypothetical protein
VCSIFPPSIPRSTYSWWRWTRVRENRSVVRGLLPRLYQLALLLLPCLAMTVFLFILLLLLPSTPISLPSALLLLHAAGSSQESTIHCLLLQARWKTMTGSKL